MLPTRRSTYEKEGGIRHTGTKAVITGEVSRSVGGNAAEVEEICIVIGNVQFKRPSDVGVRSQSGTMMVDMRELIADGCEGCLSATLSIWLILQARSDSHTDHVNVFILAAYYGP